MTTYAETARKLAELVAAGVAEVTIEIDEGEITLPIDDAIEAFHELAPGEAYDIVSAGAAAVFVTNSARNSTGAMVHLADARSLERYNEAIAACGSGANYRSISRRKTRFGIVAGATFADVTCAKCRKLGPGSATATP